MKNYFISITILLIGLTNSYASWTERFNINADLRLRHELITDDSKVQNAKDRSRSRLRARVKLTGQITEDSLMVFQLASGSNDPVSTNQTQDGGFSSKDIKLDLAYFQQHFNEETSLTAGKIKFPFYRSGKSQLVFDGDLNPEGLSLNYHTETYFANFGGFWVEENSSASDTTLLGLQLGWTPKFNEQRLNIVAAYYHYGAIENRPFIYDTTDSFGNSTDLAGTNYAYGYRLLEFMLDTKFKVNGYPIKPYAHYVENVEVSKDNQGFLVGFGFGDVKQKGDWGFDLNYRKLEKDAVLGVFAESDFAGGGTDGKGFRGSVATMLNKKLKLGVTQYLNDKGVSNSTDYSRTQFDLSFKL